MRPLSQGHEGAAGADREDVMEGVICGLLEQGLARHGEGKGDAERAALQRCGVSCGDEMHGHRIHSLWI